MASQQIIEYYNSTQHREIRPELRYAIKIVSQPKIAIDCGCGAGVDIEFLLSSGFKVYGFDIEDESITRCKARFKDNKHVILSKAGFSTYKYPRSSLIVADASLFFCPQKDFNNTWCKIYESLYPDGVFCGSFLGPEDTMAGPCFDTSSFWPGISVFQENEVRALFSKFNIHRFTEHKSTGETPQGQHHEWHIFSVVATKLNEPENMNTHNNNSLT